MPTHISPGTWKTLLVGMFLGVLFARIFESISRYDNEMQRLNDHHDKATQFMNMPQQQQQQKPPPPRSKKPISNNATMAKALRKHPYDKQKREPKQTIPKEEEEEEESPKRLDTTKNNNFVDLEPHMIDHTSMTMETYNRLVEEQRLPLAGPPYDFNFSAPPVVRDDVKDFERQPGVVLATKIHGPNMMFMLEQCLCLLHHAYNHRVLYDIIVFSTAPVDDAELVDVRQMIAPAKLTVVVDNRGLQQEIQALSPLRRETFLERCFNHNPNLTHVENITWWTECPSRLAYNWQAEFRSWHIWRNPALAPYKYMVWLDADAFCTKPWTTDPVAHMVRNDLVILFANYPQGFGTDHRIHERVFNYFNQSICEIKLDPDEGYLTTKLKWKKCVEKKIFFIHGFFHITNLDFYRSDYVVGFEESFIGDCFLCREFDDQAGVTIPAVMLAPQRSQAMRKNGMKLEVYHNFFLDGQKKERVGGFLGYWANHVQHNLTSAKDVCPIKARY